MPPVSLFLYLNEFELTIIATNLSLAYKYKFPIVIIGTAGFQQIVYQHQYIFSIIFALFISVIRFLKRAQILKIKTIHLVHLHL